jgi:hypothetical protein
MYKQERSNTMAYRLEGSLLEVCDCKVLCPCWIGEDPDNGTCDSALAYRFDTGTIDGVDVSGLSLGLAAHIPGNVLKGNFRVILFIDERATPQQEQALIQAFTGKLGGPLADYAQLFGEVVGIERAPIAFEVEQGQGRLRIGTVVEAELEPYRGATGAPTTLHETIFSTIAGAPAYVGKAPTFKMTTAALGLNVDLQNHNAIQGSFRFEG